MFGRFGIVNQVKALLAISDAILLNSHDPAERATAAGRRSQREFDRLYLSLERTATGRMCNRIIKKREHEWEASAALYRAKCHANAALRNKSAASAATAEKGRRAFEKLVAKYSEEEVKECINVHARNFMIAEYASAIYTTSQEARREQRYDEVLRLCEPLHSFNSVRYAASFDRPTQHPDVFISYKREDQSRVEEIAAALQHVYLDVWLDVRMLAGSTFDQQIEDAVRCAGCVLVCWSERAATSDWVLAEAEIGHARNRLVACSLEPCVLPDRFQDIHTQWVGNDRLDSTNLNWNRLVSSIRTRLREPRCGDLPASLLD